MKTLAYSIVCATLLVVVWAGKAQITYKLGPLYLLEWIFVFWSLTHVGWLWKNKKEWVSHLAPWLCFLVWGGLLLIYDFISNPAALHSPLSQRVVRHSVLFIYPAVWSLIGYAWVAQKIKWLKPFLILVTLVSAYTHFSNLWLISRGFPSQGWVSDGWVANIAIGPIAFIPMALTSSFALFSGLTTAFFIPIWKNWEIYIQRTYLLEFFLTSGIIFLLFKRNILRLFWVPTVFGVGALLWLALFSDSSSRSITDRFFASVQHGDDTPAAVDPNIPITYSSVSSPIPGLRSRFRTFCWKQALLDWAERPLLGRGFIPEIPSYIQPDWPNTRGLESPTAPPVAGPHNSFLTILARMGPIGVGILLWILWSWLGSWKQLTGMPQVWRLVLFFIPFNGLVHAGLNVGLESPHNCILLWFIMGATVALGKAPFDRDLTDRH